jgi:nicotinate-nucleotide adenylyltransferase
MLKLFVTLKDHYLKVRPAHGGEILKNGFYWGETLHLQFTEDTSYMMYWTSLLPDLSPPDANALVDLVAARYPLSEKYFQLKDKCPDLIFNDSQEEWIFYGGSFNPWHQGHQNCLNLLPEGKTCVIVPDINPLKEKISFELVSKILSISSKCRIKDHQYLCPTFLYLNKKNPTSEWVEFLKKIRPDKKISLLMGFDSLYSIQSWFKYDELLKNLYCIYVASRMESTEMQDEVIKKIQPFNPQLKLIFLGRHADENVSSSALRKI